MTKLLTIKEASKWASKHLKKDVTTSNISYLIQYGKVSRIGDNGTTQVLREELAEYYGNLNNKNEQKWKDKFGDDLNWALSFDQYKESETTKHVNRLHPYKGKFIPQLVEYFLDDHVDEFKKNVFFKKDDIILDPFCGSGTTLVQSNELGINGIGIDVSVFNTKISNSKINKYDFALLNKTAEAITKKLKKFLIDKKNIEFENHLLDELKGFNSEHFPSPDFKHKIYDKGYNDKEFGVAREKDFLPIYNKLVKKYKIKLKQDKGNTFLDKWFTQVIREEIDFAFKEIESIKGDNTKDILRIILSRTIRSCRATTHSDLATLFEPVLAPYYCRKHGKICKPLFSILSWWKRYSTDTIKRLKEFDKLKTNTSQICLTGDSRKINIFKELKTKLPEFGKLTKDKKIDGIFSSPPYVGLIDYHEQHAY
ncbi:MAG: site-specific DNA-methyltransferase, partial [Candidatus Delongbacteria bacterium]|nr:site-specific DNA-methyltransferase [Candidatus Delongbacteria bacterium]